MITTLQHELITAAVDGDLSAEESLAFRLLLRQEPWARELYRQLTEDADALRRLPTASAPNTIVPNVLSAISPVIPSSHLRPRKQKFAKTYWLGYATTAAIFCVMVWGSYRVFLDPQKSSVTVLTTVVESENGSHSPSADPILNLPKAGISTVIPPPRLVPELNPLTPLDQTQVAQALETAPPPRSAYGDLVGAGLMEPTRPLVTAEARLPILCEANQLGTEDIQSQLLTELEKDSAYRFNLFSTDPIKAIELFTSAAKTVSIRLKAEAFTQERVNRQLPIAYAIYTESLNAKQIAQLFKALALELADPKVQQTIGMAHLMPITVADQRDLKDLLGLDRQWLLQRQSTPNETPKSIQSSTIQELKQSLQKTSGHQGLVLTYAPVSSRVSPAQSAEIQGFFESLPAREPDQIPLLIVIRPDGK